MRALHDALPICLQAFHEALFDAGRQADAADQLALIRAHPELAGKQAIQGTPSKASAQEQQGAGLDQCSAGELERLNRLNAAYRKRFGFPFIIAVKGLSRHQIMDAIDARLLNDRDTELSTCLQEIGKNARFRLNARYR